MKRKNYRLIVLLALVFGATLDAQRNPPQVTMSITPSGGGAAREVKTRANTLGRTKLEDGTEFAFRPSMLDVKLTKFSITVFKMNPAENLGDIEVTVGGPAVETKTMPSFKVAIAKVEP